MTLKLYRSPLFLAFLDFLIFNGAFFGMNYWKRGTFVLSPLYEKLLVILFLLWLIVSIVTKKFRFDFRRSYWDLFFLLARSTLYLVYCVAIGVVAFVLQRYSRVQVFGTCFLLFVGELLLFTLLFIMVRRDAAMQGANSGDIKSGASLQPERRHLLILSVTDFILVTGIFFIVHYCKRGTFTLSHNYEELLLIMYGLWLATALVTRKFYSGYRNYYYAIAQWVKAIIFMGATMAVLIFAFRMFYYSRLQVFSYLLVLLIAESIFYAFFYVHGVVKAGDSDIESADEVKQAILQAPLSFDLDIEDLRARLTRPIRTKLSAIMLDSPETFRFIDETVDLSHIIKAETSIINSSEMFYITNINEHPRRLFINTGRINDIRWINRYFLEVFKILLPGGYFVGRVHTTELYKKKFFKKYPKYLSHILYVINYVFMRVLPKLSLTKRLYFTVTKGKNRALSRAEVLGRLSFCGFRIIAERGIGDDIYFIAQKAKKISIDDDPSYGPLVTLDRVGLQGRVIAVYKFRTMHPYSEYLQDYVFELNELQPGGKIKDDFRVTTLGRFMRRTWIDELPMLYNWVRGELKLVGVRPLSHHYFSLYPEDLQALRLRVAPGLIPPFYADLPKTFDEICESERRYIHAYRKNPMVTQWRYFWRAMYNIIVKKARSA